MGRTEPRVSTFVTGRSLGLIVCSNCRATVRAIGAERSLCPRCGGHLHERKPHSIALTASLVLSAALLYIPANILPVMNTRTLFSDDDDTIMSGVISLAHSGSWPIALLVFVASIVIPLLKLIALGEILYAVARKSSRHPGQRSRMFRIVEFIGRWSMLDVFAVSLLVALVQMRSFATVHVRLGAFAFAAVVVLTMLATQSFDERLLWDSQKHG
jgi:paraquat-inducible protein A